MRRMLCLALILLLSLCACSSDDRTEREIEYKGNLYTINMEDGTITSGGQVYRYEQSPGSGTFTYPDGSTCWWSQRDNGELWGWSDDYDPEAGGYVDAQNRPVIAPRFRWAGDFHEGRAEVETDTGMGLIDKQGRYIIPPEYEIVEYAPAESVVRVRQHGRWALYDYLGRRLTEFGAVEP